MQENITQLFIYFINNYYSIFILEKLTSFCNLITWPIVVQMISILTAQVEKNSKFCVMFSGIEIEKENVFKH